MPTAAEMIVEFLAQQGVYTSGVSGQVEVEDSCQIVIIDLSQDPLEAFTTQMIELGEAIAEELDQEYVFVEVQQGGIAVEMIGCAGPRVSL